MNTITGEQAAEHIKDGIRALGAEASHARTLALMVPPGKLFKAAHLQIIAAREARESGLFNLADTYISSAMRMRGTAKWVRSVAVPAPQRLTRKQTGLRGTV